LDRSTKSAQSLLKTRFEQQVAISTRANRYALEDPRLNLTDTIEDYVKQIRNRLAFLREQAAIARFLGFAKNTIEAQIFKQPFMTSLPRNSSPSRSAHSLWL